MWRLGDFVLACAMLLVVLPLLGFVAVAIKCDSTGPILEHRESIGGGGRRFRLLKFRTTPHDAERGSSAWNVKLTRVGEFLHYTRIEHLPELINVLRGEMSLLDSSEHSRLFPD
jgi:lipopolysaccharide/colanic/teichoic acid biosynthesis glycosyltransferase